MSVYRRGAIYWWRRQIRLGATQAQPIMLRISLKTSDRAEAKRRALALDLELEMVAVRFPDQQACPAPEKLRAIYKEALEYKRDQIVAIQRRPPFDDAQHRLYNSAYSRIFGAIARVGAWPSDPNMWRREMSGSEIGDEERGLIADLIESHAPAAFAFETNSAALEQTKTVAQNGISPCGRPAIAPRILLHLMANAGLDDTSANRRLALSIVAAAYGQACREANRRLDEHVATEIGPDIPRVLAELLESRDQANTDCAKTTVPSTAPVDLVSAALSATSLEPTPAADQLGGLIDLRMSQLCALVVEENSRSGDWQDSACRNAKAISDIFIAENGDLRMSQIDRRHLLALDRRLKRLPAIWGKSREDRAGGLKHVFARGEQLAAEWDADPEAANRNKVPKVGLSATTHNRHINTLKQLFDYARDLEDGDGNATHVHPRVGFQNLRQKDRRKKNARKPVPSEEDLRSLVSGPVFTGCAGQNDRLTPGSSVIHDSFYWGPLLLIVYGARSNELCQMPLANIYEDALVAHFKIRASRDQTIKTAATDRDLPIAPKLIELGFLDYVRALRSKGEYWLFPELNTTKVPARKRFREDVFVPLLQHHFPDGTSSLLDGKDIDTQSLRKFATTYLRKATPKIELGIRQAYFGHERATTLEGTYEDDPSLEELMPCVKRMGLLIEAIEHYPLRLRH
ncbi:hypothetical protein [Stakelama marina]|uniref:Integrase n=1 Tax=Stakelama marina TaxID=2826939 RepID=A0A8T4INP6_9SPHN|nr:hypothetical protein [Stakelama marina]MBR0553766.1 hypothetical protein [Stakelama marina]